MTTANDCPACAPPGRIHSNQECRQYHDGQEPHPLLQHRDAPRPPEEQDESDRQAILLALAELALSRPGWADYLRRIAVNMKGAEMFEEFKRLNADRIVPRPGNPL